MLRRALLALGVVLGLAVAANAQPVGSYTVLSETLVLTPDYIEVDGDFPTSPGGGGGWMQAELVIEYLDEYDNYGFFTENISQYAQWIIDDPDVYYAEPGTTLWPDGLLIDNLYVDCIEGYTEITVTYDGLSASGWIFVRGPDWKPMIPDR